MRLFFLFFVAMPVFGASLVSDSEDGKQIGFGPFSEVFAEAPCAGEAFNLGQSDSPLGQSGSPLGHSGPSLGQSDSSLGQSGSPLGQSGSSQDTIIEVMDFNRDGIPDSLIRIRQYHELYIGFRDGKSGYKFETWYSRALWSSTMLFPYPHALISGAHQDWKPVLDMEFLRSMESRKSPEGVLEWMLSAHYMGGAKRDSGYFSKVTRFRPRWHPGPPKVPGDYALWLNKDSLNFIYNRREYYDGDTALLEQYGGGWLCFYGDYHSNSMTALGTIPSEKEGLQLVREFQGQKLWRTNYGLVLEKLGRHCWIYISDYILTDAPEKMRFESIEYADFWGPYVVVQILGEGFSQAFYLIDPGKGLVGRLNYDMLHEDQHWPGEGAYYDPNWDKSGGQVFRIRKSRPSHLEFKGKSLELSQLEAYLKKR